MINFYRSLTNLVVKEKGEAKATKGSVNFSISLKYGINQRTFFIIVSEHRTSPAYLTIIDEWAYGLVWLVSG